MRWVPLNSTRAQARLKVGGCQEAWLHKCMDERMGKGDGDGVMHHVMVVRACGDGVHGVYCGAFSMQKGGWDTLFSHRCRPVGPNGVEDRMDPTRAISSQPLPGFALKGSVLFKACTVCSKMAGRRMEQP